MSLHETAIARPAVAVADRFMRLAARLAAPLRALIDRLDEAAANDLAIRELQSQPDHILRDIGLDRNDIRRRVRGLTDDD